MRLVIEGAIGANMSRKIVAGLQALAAIGLLFLASSMPAMAERTVRIAFRAQIGDAAFKCGTSYPGVGTSAATVTPTDLRFYVSAVSLIDAQGRRVPVQLIQDGLWQYRDVVLMDFEDGSGPCADGGNPGLNDTVIGTAPDGNYVGLAFTVGLPFDLDHADATLAPSPLNFSALFWAWAPGYRFFKFDLTTDASKVATGGETGFSIHLGSTGCDAASMTAVPSHCSNPNLVSVELPRFDPTRDAVVLDLKQALSGADVSRNTPNTAPGCMSEQSDPDCRSVFAAFGLPIGTQPAKPQTVFRTGR